MSENVVITGGGDSVGRVIAAKCLARGDRVHICDVREEPLQRTLQANPGMRGTVADVGKASDVATLFEQVRAWMHPVSVLVNVVGVAGPLAGIEDIKNEEWDDVIHVNVNSMFYCIKEVVPGMKEAGRGSIVNFSSGSTRTLPPMRTPYVASKYAIEGLTRTLARELGPHNIRCNVILPGMINNARMQGMMERTAEATGKSVEEIEAEHLNYISMRTKIEPDEIADMVLFLASGAAPHVTGQLVGVCGNAEWEI